MQRVMGGLAALAMIATAGPAAAESWRRTAWSGAAPDRAVYLVDTDSIVRTGDTVRFRTTTIWEKLAAPRDFDRSIAEREGNCATGSSGILRTSYYAGGRIVRQNAAAGLLRTHAPGSLMAQVLNAVCGKAGYQSGRIADPEREVRTWLSANR
ncbi:surface-adhesin E family protein [Sphingomonas canadensis]|uniref:Surface-adhesin E family protein n=1 Tax=Sphingomonas canadensis TaxID=1219257 RepID=A0ABW3H432_9SPHN|nr:surface-adhesin E family protein [Sphingomonas canadensis]MCW3835459.1 hypothetical protein [Sphingomonas canadensis]